MAKYGKGPHTVYELHYHFLFITKYGKLALRGDIARRVRDLIRQICASEDVQIVKGNVSKDHVHLMVSMPPQVLPSRITEAVKGKSSHHMMSEFSTLQREFWGRHLRARKYCACTTGNVTDEVIKQYIELQGAHPQDDRDFKISE